MLPINNTDFSATLIKAKAYKPNVLLNNMGGLAQINCMKQFTQFGMEKDMALGGALFELETVKAVPPDAQAGWWDMEWWWDQPKVPEVVKFVAEYRAATKKTPSARDWFGYVAMHSVRLAAEKAKSMAGPKLAMALEDLELPPDVALQPGQGPLSRRRPRADAQYLRRPGASAERQPGQRVHGRGAGAGRGGRRLRRGNRLQDGPSGLNRSLKPVPPPRGPVRRRRSGRVALDETSREERPMLQVILFNVTNGLIIGAFYVLMALGLSLILNLSNVINFAHGNFLALGGYFAFMLTPTLGFWGALLVSPLLTALIGFVVERLMIRRVYNRDPVYSLLLTFGLAFIMQDAARYIWGPNGLPMGMPDILSQPLSADLFFITWYRIFMVAIVIVAVIGLFAFLRYTRVGLRIRAGTLDLETVAALGVNVQLLRTFNFAVGCLLAGLSGVLAAGQIGLNPNMGDDLLMPSFIAIIVGGVGSLTGTLFGGLLIGVAAALTTVVYPAASEAVIYVIMVLVLLLRPRGLMGEEGMLS